MRWVAAVIVCYCIDQRISLSIESILSDGAYGNEKIGRNVGNNPETMGKGSSQAMDIGTGKGGDKYQAPNYTQYTNQDFKGFMPNYQSMVGMSKSSNGSSGNNASEGAGSFGNFLDLKSMMDGFIELQKEQAKADALKAEISKNLTKSDTVDTDLIDDDMEVIAKKREAWPGPHGSVAINSIPVDFPGNSENMASTPDFAGISAKMPPLHHNTGNLPAELNVISGNSLKMPSDEADFTDNLEKFPAVHGKVNIGKIPMGRPGGEDILSFLGQSVAADAPNFHPEKVDILPSGPVDISPNGPVDILPDGQIDILPIGPVDILPNGPVDILPNGPIYALLLVSWRDGQFGIAPLGWIPQQDRNTKANLELHLKNRKARRNLGTPKSKNLLLVRLEFSGRAICPTSRAYLFVSNKVIVPQKTIMCPAQLREKEKSTRKLRENATLSFLMSELEKQIHSKLEDVVDKDNRTESIRQQPRDVDISFDQSGSKMELEEVSAGGGGEKGKHQGGGISVKIGMVNNKDDDKNIVRNKRQNMMNLFFTW